MPENQNPVFTDNETIQGDGTEENPLVAVASGGNPGGVLGDAQFNDGSGGFTAVQLLVSGWKFNFDPTANGGTGQLQIEAPSGTVLTMLNGGLVINAVFLGLCNGFGTTEIDIGNTNGACVLRFFNNGGGSALQAVTGSRSDPEQALKNLLAALAAYGLIVDSTTT
jgi:hypothetical protein